MIYSWSVMEHVDRPFFPDILAGFRHMLTPEGIVFTQICPLFHAPFGSHLGNFVAEPWLHLELSHAALSDRLGATGVLSPPPESGA